MTPTVLGGRGGFRWDGGVTTDLDPASRFSLPKGAPKGPKWIGTKVLGHVPGKTWGSAGIPTSPCWFHGLLDDLAGSDEWLVYYWGLQNMFVKKLEEPSIT